MTDDDKDLDELFAPLRETARDPAGHPTPEELEAYHAKELSPEDEERICEHLVACRECADLVLDLQALSVAASKPDTGVADFEQAAAWRDLREKLPFRPETVEEPVKAEPRRRRAASLWSVRGIAAVLAVAVASGVLMYRLWEPAEIQEVSLDSIGSTRSGEPDASETVRLPARLFLKPHSDSTYSEYRAEILNRAGDEIEIVPGLRRDSHFDVPLDLEQGCLEPGDYVIRLLGGRDGGQEEELIGEYRIRILDS